MNHLSFLGLPFVEQLACDCCGYNSDRARRGPKPGPHRIRYQTPIVRFGPFIRFAMETDRETVVLQEAFGRFGAFVYDRRIADAALLDTDYTPIWQIDIMSAMPEDADAAAALAVSVLEARARVWAEAQR